MLHVSKKNERKVIQVVYETVILAEKKTFRNTKITLL